MRGARRGPWEPGPAGRAGARPWTVRRMRGEVRAAPHAPAPLNLPRTPPGSSKGCPGSLQEVGGTQETAGRAARRAAHLEHWTWRNSPPATRRPGSRPPETRTLPRQTAGYACALAACLPGWRGEGEERVCAGGTLSRFLARVGWSGRRPARPRPLFTLLLFFACPHRARPRHPLPDQTRPGLLLACRRHRGAGARAEPPGKRGNAIECAALQPARPPRPPRPQARARPAPASAPATLSPTSPAAPSTCLR